MRSSRGFTYLDTIFGLTALLLLIGFIYGSLQLVKQRTMNNKLTTIADAFSNEIFNELSLRIFDENIEDFRTLGLTIKNDFGADESESQDDFSTLDDIDDFHGITITNPAYVGMTASVELDYVKLDTINLNINTSNAPTTLKRTEIEISHTSLSNPYRTSRIFGANMLPAELINPPYVTKMLLVDETPGINIIMPGDALSFKVAFNEDVFIRDQEDDFALYINLNFGILTGDIGTYQNRSSLPGEVRANYVSGNGTDTLMFRYEVEENHASTDIDQFLGYTNELTIQNGRLVNSEDKEMINSLPGPDSEDSNFDQFNIVGLLEPIESYIYTQDQVDQFNQQNEQQFIEQSMLTIFNTWARFDGQNYSDRAPFSGNSLAWRMNADQTAVFMPLNVDPANGFVSPDALENYTLEATLAGGPGDNDTIGLIAIFSRVDDTSYNVAVIRSMNGSTPNGNKGVFGIVSGEAGDHTIDYSHNSRVVGIPSPTISQGGVWTDRYVRIKVQRNGSIIRAWIKPSQSSRASALDEDYIEESLIEIDIDDLDHSQHFQGPQKYGYITFSQPNSTWYDVELLGGAGSRLDVSILVSGTGSDTSVDEFNQANDDGVYEEQNVDEIQSALGYPRKATNPNTDIVFLITSDNVIFYPEDWP